jgi:hypothetical protein
MTAPGSEFALFMFEQRMLLNINKDRVWAWSRIPERKRLAPELTLSYLIGGAYCRPPLVHRLFGPRGMARRVFRPRWRS